MQMIYRKKIFDAYDESDKITVPLKRPSASSSRDFPRCCGSIAPEKELKSQDFSRGKKRLKVARNDIVIAAKPLKVFPSPEVNFMYAKPSVVDGCEVNNVHQNFSGKESQESDPAAALGKAKSGNAEGSGDLADMNVSSQAINFNTKYPPPKIRKGVTISRNFPPNCGKNQNTKENGRRNSKTKPCKMIGESTDKSVEDDNQDSFIIGQQPRNVPNGNVVKDDQNEPSPVGQRPRNVSNGNVVQVDQNEPSPVGQRPRNVSNGNVVKDDQNEPSPVGQQPSNVSKGNVVKDAQNEPSPFGQPVSNVSNWNVVKDDQNEPSLVTDYCPSIQEPNRCDFDWKEEETNDMEICNITQSEWNQWQSVYNRHNLRKKDMGDEPLIKYHCEENSTDARIENYEEDPSAEDLKNLCIVPYDAGKSIAAGSEVQQALKLFEELYAKLLMAYKAEAESKGGRVTKQVHYEAAVILRNDHKWTNVEPIFGHVPGIEVGDKFQFRAQLAVVGLHHEFICGINCVTVDGKKYANSVVDSGRYDNKVVSRDVILYSGQGGNPKVLNLANDDQKLEGGNLALKHSKDANLPVRVIRKVSLGKQKMYIYEGLYKVTNFWKEKNRSDKLTFMFEMVRILDQPDCSNQEMVEPRTSTGYLEQGNHTATSDLSRGKEKIPISVVNDINDEKPPAFTYITEMRYPSWYHLSEPGGCECIDGCSDYKPCSCAYKNGGEIPFNEEGFIIKAKRLVHECGPLCKCPPSCQNRVSQRGPRFQLEVFRTKTTGWGVRSREDIPSGSFICEYIGEVLPDKEAEKKTNDEYLFDLDDCNSFTLDAAEYGNVGRFINHSCSPNLYAQNVVYDNDDKRLPHIMLFATKKIPALQELSYDYNYKIDRVCDAKGNVKKKICYCGSRKCTGRMY